MGIALLTGCNAHQNSQTVYSLTKAPHVQFWLDPGPGDVRQKNPTLSVMNGIVLGIDKNAPLPFDRRVILKQPDGQTRELLVSMPKDLPLPFRSGERLVVHTAQQWDTNANQLQQAFHIVDGKKETRLILQRNNLLPKQHIPPEIVVTSGKRVVYTESRRIDGVCFTTTEHRELKLTIGGTPAEMPPGRIITIHLDSGPFQWMAVDNRITMETNCDTTPDDASIWLILRTENP